MSSTTIGSQTAFLSTRGAALIPTAATPLVPFTTGGFLDSFEPDPTTGKIIIPHVSEDKMTAGPLTDERIGAARATVYKVVTETRELEETLKRWGIKFPYPLPATGGRWHVMHDMKNTFRFYSNAGRVVIFSDKADGGTIQVGGTNNVAAYYQLSEHRGPSIAGDELSAPLYLMEFYQQGVVGLAHYFGLQPDVSLNELALAIVNSMCTFDAHVPFDKKNTPRVNSLRMGMDNYVALKKSGARWRYPSRDLLKEKTVLEVRCDLDGGSESGNSLGIHAIFDMAMSIPVCPYYGKNLHQKLLPLWEGARLLAGLDDHAIDVKEG